MKQQVVVIHGGNAYDTYDIYLKSLRSKGLTIEELRSVGWKSNLAQDLGENFDVLNPRMPNANNAQYKEWKLWFEKIIPLLNDNVVFVGHSIGGIFLVKYLSENKYPKSIKATFLVAAPYNTPTRHPLADFNIDSSLDKFIQQAGKITIYHSTDDTVVPYNNAEYYHQDLPKSQFRIFKNRGHFIDEHFPEIVEEITQDI